MGKPATCTLKVRHYEVDEYGHANHASYVHYLETARIDALESVGLGLRSMREQGHLIVAVELGVKYLTPTRAGDVLEITTWIREIRGARSFWVQEIRDAATRRLVVTAEVTGALMSEDGKPQRTPDTIRERLGAFVVGP